MNKKRTNIEIIAPSVEEAVDQGLQDLGLRREAVDIEILDEGSRGLFGLGSRQARVRLTIKTASESREARPSPVSTTYQPQPSEPQVETASETAPKTTSIEEDFVLTIARDVVSELLEKMRVRAKVTAEYGEPDDERSRVPVRVNIYGDDLSILIGRQAETLNALQYISSLIISKEIGRPIPLVVDVEGYRSRRENQLRQLARRMADQAIKAGRRQVLEPMSANERRIIHIELRDNPQVTTESIDEEPRRKITIIPK
jgi:spoIIIJ-associated protein